MLYGIFHFTTLILIQSIMSIQAGTCQCLSAFFASLRSIRVYYRRGNLCNEINVRKRGIVCKKGITRQMHEIILRQALIFQEKRVVYVVSNVVSIVAYQDYQDQ